MKIEKKIYFPLFASELLNGGFQSDEEGKRVWQQLTSLPPHRMNIILSKNIAEALAKLEESFGISEKSVEATTVLTRRLFTGEISRTLFWDALAAQLRGEKIQSVEGITLQQHIQNFIIECLPDSEVQEEYSDEVQPLIVTEKQILLDALAKFPNLGSQIITTQKLKLKNQLESVRPSLSNWLRVYRDELGIGHHDAAARAKFLFESANTKSLSAEERERIHILVRSLEDEELVNIDPGKSEIVFILPERIANEVNTQRVSPSSTREMPEDIFERFATNAPSAPVAAQPARAFPTPLQGVGSSQFGSLTPLPPKNKEDEKSLLLRIQKMKTAELPEHPSKSASVPETEPLGKVSFSGPQVLGHETAPRAWQSEKVRSSLVYQHNFNSTKEATKPQQSQDTVFINKKDIPSPLPNPFEAKSQQPISTPSVSQSAPTIAVKEKPAFTPLRQAPAKPQSVFHIKPNRD